MQWTKEQRETIEIRRKNILISAAAGSGKTTVLVERIKNLVINEGIDIDRFLITTFTKAAAAEMRERLEKAIRKELKNSNADRQKLLRQLQKLPSSNISTFHSFAIEIIRQYFYLTDLEPGFGIGDEIQMGIMKREAIEKVFSRRYEEDYDNFSKFLWKYCTGKSDNKLRENILDTYKTLVSIPRYILWAKTKAEGIKTEHPLEAVGAYGYIARDIVSKFDKAAEGFLDAAQIVNTPESPLLYALALADAEAISDLAELAREKLDTDESRYDESLKTRIQDFGGTAFAYTYKRMSVSKKLEEPLEEETKENLQETRKAAKNIIKKLQQKYFTRSFDEMEQDLIDVHDDTVYYIDIIEEFDDTFKAMKSDAKVIDFDDVMHYAIEVLENPEAADELREKFEYIFIDEYQDSNYLQEEIVRRIAGEDNLFMVGDVKQCIYKFRLAEPELFMERADRYKNKKELSSILLNLNSNFRSKKYVTEPINDLFGEVMAGYDEDSALHCTAPDAYPGIPARIHVVNIEKGVESSQSASIEREDAEAAAIAQIIREHLGSTIYDTKRNEERVLTLRDFAVLARGNNTIEKVERYLINEGIDAYGEGSGKYFETVEIQVFLNLLRIIINIRQDVPLISAMRSVVFGFSIEELVEIRIQSSEGSFSNAVKEYKNAGCDEKLRKKISNMLETVNLWKEISRTVPLEELINKVLFETGYYDYCSGLPVGSQRVSNLRLIADKAAGFERISHGGLYGFLQYIESMKESGGNESEARVISENEDVVRVMTIHKSKGLEFPVVILAGASKSITAKSSSMPITVHRDFGIGLNKVNRKEHWHRNTFIQTMIDDVKKKEQFEEEIRILYVALTRAKDCLEIVGKAENVDKFEKTITPKSFLAMIYRPFMARSEIECVVYSKEEDFTKAFEYRRRSPKELYDELERAEASGFEKEIAEKIDERLSFVYPYEKPLGIKAKYSVSELNSDKPSAEYKTQTARPEFVEDRAGEGRRLSASEIGVLMHTMMEKLDFSEAVKLGNETEESVSDEACKDYIVSVADRLLFEGSFSTEEYDAIQFNKITKFFKSEIGTRAAKAAEAGKLYREKEFIMSKKNNGTQTIVQGVIDCYFEENERLVLIDFKNSYVGKNRSIEDIAEIYREQIELYKEALEGGTGMKVAESYLYLFEVGKFISY